MNSKAESITFEARCQPPHSRTLIIPRWVCEKLRLKPGDTINIAIKGLESSYKNFRTFNFVSSLQAGGKVSFPFKMGLQITVSRGTAL